MINYYSIAPCKKLEPYVRFFWAMEGDISDSPYIYRSMADSCTELIFHYRGTFDELADDGSTSDSFLSGIQFQSRKYSRFLTKEQFGIFGVYLYPFASRRLLRLSPVELTNEMPDLHSALGRMGRELEERVLGAADNIQRVAILTSYLERQLDQTEADDHPAQSAVRYVIESKKLETVDALAARFNLSERQFERKFREYSGFNPKLCMRIVRFGEACNQYNTSKGETLTEIALRCGYYDQSHFIRDFREFSGYDPRTFFRGKAEGIEWREQETLAMQMLTL